RMYADALREGEAVARDLPEGQFCLEVRAQPTEGLGHTDAVETEFTHLLQQSWRDGSALHGIELLLDRLQLLVEEVAHGLAEHVLLLGVILRREDVLGA